MSEIKGLRQITPYVAGQQPKGQDIIKLNTNENAYPPSPKVAARLETFDTDQLRRYSSLDQSALRTVLAQQLQVPADQIIVGNGSDDILSMAFLAFFNSGEPILFPDLTYGFYKVWADLYHIPYLECPLDHDFKLLPEAYMGDNGGLVLTNPNAPTGLALPLSEIEAIVAANQEVVVIIDEAYISFGGETALPLLDKYDNVFITRTFSKDAALAGLRVGYGIGSPKLMAVIQAVKNAFNPYNVDMLSEDLAVAAVTDWTYYEETCRKICQTRDWFSAELVQLGFEVLPSQTNFILAEPTTVSAQDLFEQLKAQGIYVRYFPTIERLKHKLRISIGSQTEMVRVLEVIKTQLGLTAP